MQKTNGAKHRFKVYDSNDVPDLGAGKRMSRWKVVEETKGGFIVIAHIPDYLKSPQATAGLICACLNSNRRFKIPSDLI